MSWRVYQRIFEVAAVIAMMAGIVLMWMQIDSQHYLIYGGFVLLSAGKLTEALNLIDPRSRYGTDRIVTSLQAGPSPPPPAFSSCLLAHIPRRQPDATRIRPAVRHWPCHCGGCARSSPARTRRGSWASGTGGTHGRARSSHGQRSPHDISEAQDRASPECRLHEAGSESPAHEVRA